MTYRSGLRPSRYRSEMPAFYVDPSASKLAEKARERAEIALHMEAWIARNGPIPKVSPPPMLNLPIDERGRWKGMNAGAARVPVKGGWKGLRRIGWP